MSKFLPVYPLGKTNLRVTKLCVGCAELGNMPDSFAYSVDEVRGLDTVRAILQAPINFLDTAAMYGDGESERRIGLVLRERGGIPPGYVLATKVDRDMSNNNYSGEQTRRSLERSLKLLGVSKLPLVYLHDPEHNTFESIMAKGGAVEVLQKYKEQGVIEHIGLASGPIDLMIRYLETGSFEVVITHNRYTLLNRSAEPLLQTAQRLGVAVVNAAPYGSGILVKGPDVYPRYAYQTASAEVVAKVRQLNRLCQEAGIPLPAAALQFSLKETRIASTIVGMSRPERLQQTITYAQYPIPADLWPRLDAVGFETVDPEAGRWK